MDNAQSQLIEKLQSSTNILVTVSRNPTVDQLSACLGLTLVLNKLGKHATAVYSGITPSTLEFLQPEQTLEKTTDSLRDFIIALDKTKADKLRYKVEDDMVRIFITPYRVSITDKDLEFSQGDFNVDVVVALGVNQQEDFDEAITAHGRILHDAVVGSIAIQGGVDLGGINWSNGTASSLSEMIVSLSKGLGEDLLDEQVATALLTGIVSETARFSNEKTTSQTMNISAELMSAGANQQLVATKLAEPVREPEPAEPEPAEDPNPEAVEEPVKEELPKPVDGTLEIDHTSIDEALKDLDTSDNEPAEETTEPKPEDRPAGFEVEDKREPTGGSNLTDNNAPRLITEPPTLGGKLTANTEPEHLDPPNDILGLPSQPQTALLNRSALPAAQSTPDAPAPSTTPSRLKIEPSMAGFTPPPPAWVPPNASQDTADTARTLSEIEQAVHATDPETLDDARDEVARALNSQPPKAEPLQAIGAQPMGDPLHVDEIPASATPAFTDVLSQVIPAAQPAATAEPMLAEPAGLQISASGELQMPVPTVNDPTAPPPVPPPIPFNFGTPPTPPKH